MPNILIVEDEKTINDLVTKNLRLVGHICEQAFDGSTGLNIALEKKFDLLILDIMLPYINGFDMIKKLPDIPVIFLTARDSLQDRVKGLNLGADDYIVKPFEALELIARVNAVLRRTKKAENKFVANDVEVDLISRNVKKDNKTIELTPREFELLEVLITHRNIALSRDKLLELAWGYDYMGETRTVDSHIQKLRMKLGWEGLIKTVFKIGYRLEV